MLEKLSIRTQILVTFATLATISLIVISAISLGNVNNIGNDTETCEAVYNLIMTHLEANRLDKVHSYYEELTSLLISSGYNKRIQLFCDLANGLVLFLQVRNIDYPLLIMILPTIINTFRKRCKQCRH